LVDLSTRLKELLMSVQDGQRLGVMDSVSVTVRCLVYTVKCADWATDSPAAMLKDRWRHYSPIAPTMNKQEQNDLTTQSHFYEGCLMAGVRFKTEGKNVQMNLIFSDIINVLAWQIKTVEYLKLLSSTVRPARQLELMLHAFRYGVGNSSRTIL
jgi:hypothetical protein